MQTFIFVKCGTLTNHFGYFTRRTCIVLDGILYPGMGFERGNSVLISKIIQLPKRLNDRLYSKRVPEWAEVVTTVLIVFSAAPLAFSILFTNLFTIVLSFVLPPIMAFFAIVFAFECPFVVKFEKVLVLFLTLAAIAHLLYLQLCVQ